MELGPLDEKSAILVDTGFPTSVLERLNLTVGELYLSQMTHNVQELGKEQGGPWGFCRG